MTTGNRIGAIDILKGFIIISIVFLNVLYLNSLPLWTDDSQAPTICTIIAGIIFPSLIFLIGMTIPFSVTKKINQGMDGRAILRHIFSRSLVLIAVGVLMVNSGRVEPELTGFSKFLWAVLLYLAIFLVWNRYPEKENNFFTVTGLRFAGLALLVFLVFKFRSGTFENNGSLITGWWELPGLAGWGYLIAGLTYIVFRNSLAGTIAVWVLFLALNILSELKMTGILDPVKPYLGVLVNGHIPVIILSGQLTTIVLKRFSGNEYRKPLIILLISGTILAASGILLHRYYFTEGIYDNPAWALISSGITTLVFIALYWLDEGIKIMNPAIMIKPTGENIFTIYIIQFLLFNIAWLTGADIFFFLKTGALFLNIAGAVIWTILVLGTSTILIRFNVRLKF